VRPSPPRGSAVAAAGADGGVADLGHGGGHRRGHGGGGGAVFAALLPPAQAAAEAVAAAAAGEGGQQGLAEAHVHEAVNDGVDAARGVGQQVDEGDGGSRESSGGRLQVEGLPGVGRVQGHPADEEERHDHHQHADDALLGLQLGVRGAAGLLLLLLLLLGLLGLGEGGELQGGGGLFGHLGVAAVVLVVGRGDVPSPAVLPACGGGSQSVNAKQGRMEVHEFIQLPGGIKLHAPRLFQMDSTSMNLTHGSMETGASQQQLYFT